MLLPHTYATPACDVPEVTINIADPNVSHRDRTAEGLRGHGDNPCETTAPHRTQLGLGLGPARARAGRAACRVDGHLLRRVYGSLEPRVIRFLRTCARTEAARASTAQHDTSRTSRRISTTAHLSAGAGQGAPPAGPHFCMAVVPMGKPSAAHTPRRDESWQQARLGHAPCAGMRGRAW